MARLLSRTGTFALVLLAGPAACAGGQESAIPSEPPPGFRYAYAAPSCAPWDGFAVSLVLRDDALTATDSMIEAGDRAHLQIGLYPRGSEGIAPSGLAPGTFRWPNQPEMAGGARCENGRCEAAPTGRVIIRDVQPDGRFSGEVDVILRNGEPVRGSFQADWRTRQMFCG
jgi:hypothetical protein